MASSAAASSGTASRICILGSDIVSPRSFFNKYSTKGGKWAIVRARQESLAFPLSAVPGRISAQTSLYHLSATALFPPKHTPPANTRAKKGAPPGALLSGKQLTIVLAAFTAVLQMSCRHLFLLPYLLSLRLSLLLWCQSPLLCQSEFLFRLLYQRISVSHLCMWLCR